MMAAVKPQKWDILHTEIAHSFLYIFLARTQLITTPDRYRGLRGEPWSVYPHEYAVICEKGIALEYSLIIY